MKIMQLHVDYVEYEPIQPEAGIYEEAERKIHRIEEALLLLTSIEKDDDRLLAVKAMDDAAAFMEKLKIPRLVIYPYAHLSTDLAPPTHAMEIFNAMKERARTLGLNFHAAPFGWNKRLVISVKGHPLAEQLKSYTAEAAARSSEEVPQALLLEEKLESYWHVLTPGGEMIPVEKFDFSGHENLEAFAKYEMQKSRAVLEQPPHVSLMKRLEIADHEPASDPGNVRWYAKGRLIKSLLEEYVTKKVIEYGGIELETPIMYDMEHPALRKYLHKFPARQYVIPTEDKKYFLRFAACFGQFLIARDMQLSYRHLPLWLYELTRYSFRREKSGELAGLKRLRAFTMPDVHALCKDLEQAKEEMKRRLKLSLEVMEGIGFDRDYLEMAIRFTKDFYEENKDFIFELVRIFGKPVLAEMWSERYFYFVLKWEFNFVDCQRKAAALSTDQIDVENARSYGITYVNESGEEAYPIILHCSPSGAIERVIYALLEKAELVRMRGGKPMLSTWLSPTQVRIIPVRSKYIPDCIELIEEFERNRIRVDVDDRDETVDKRIRDAETEWIPYIVVYGEREKKSGILSVRIRAEDRIEFMKPEDLITRIREETKDKPFKELPLPKLLSRRPSFR
ncbi:MAG: threonine--tRNA ligase [Aigarchaeota archaeon]|nr:threonine--tRNA ligase [Aigarchaeota archaeon]MDW8021296.1 threonine--tRNA ligase [Nitrososphaerota archaeon]